MPDNRTPAPPPRIVVAPDSFKGSLTARQVAAAIERGILQSIPDARVLACPMADGGEGTLDAMLHAGGERRMVRVRDAAGRFREAPVAILPDGTAVIETAEIVGITDEPAMAAPAARRSTEGIGDAIDVLAGQGVRRILVALGGTSTNDGGSGMLRALGARLLDTAGGELPPGSAALAGLHRIEAGALAGRLAGIEIVGLSDVTNPLCGSDGATEVFGPQKGLESGEERHRIDEALARYAAMLEEALARKAASTAGAGAAGGLGFALLMVGATLRSGAQTVCDQLGLDGLLEGSDWLITGEGRSDAQTLQGKAPFVAAARAARCCPG